MHIDEYIALNRIPPILLLTGKICRGVTERVGLKKKDMQLYIFILLKSIFLWYVLLCVHSIFTGFCDLMCKYRMN